MHGMNQRPTPGTFVDELETPVLLIDMDAMEHNIGVIAARYRDTDVKLRPHVKNHKSPQIAWMQISAGGTVGGIVAAKVAEAEVFVEAGIPNVLIANQIVAPDKVRRLASLAKRADVMVAVDDVEQVRRLSAGANELGATIGVVIEVNTSLRRAGIRAVEQAAPLAQAIADAPGLRFKGVMSHQTPTEAYPDREERLRNGSEYFDMVIEAKLAIEAAGLPVEVVSTGETWTYDVAPTVPGITEIEGGTYIVMEVPYAYMTEFRLAAKVMGTVVSRPSDHLAIGDVSVEAIGAPGDMPTVEGSDGVRVQAMSLEGTILESNGPMPLRVGDRYTLLTHQQDMTMNRWDQYVGVRDGRVEAVFEVTARGCHN